MLALLPLWAVIYALTLDPPTPTEPGPFELGAEIYAGKGCSGCHGAGGAGAGAVPGADHHAAEDFARARRHGPWVALGTAGYQAAGHRGVRAGQAGRRRRQMPAWADSLTAEELMSVVLHERTVYGGETFDIAHVGGRLGGVAHRAAARRTRSTSTPPCSRSGRPTPPA